MANEVKHDNNGDVEVMERTSNNHPTAPDGGWGWVIVLVTLCVMIISHGLQVTLGMYLMAVPKSSIISRRLLNGSVEQSGKQLTQWSWCLV